MKDWEKDEQKILIEIYNKGLYKKLLERYCHEDVGIRCFNLNSKFPTILNEENWVCSKGNTKPVQVFICSQSVVTDTAEQGMKFWLIMFLNRLKKVF